jgi:hypothetical protein
MTTAERKKQDEQGSSSDAAVIERLTQLERKVDALCRYLLPHTGEYASPDVLPVWLLKSAELRPRADDAPYRWTTRCRPTRRSRR